MRSGPREPIGPHAAFVVDASSAKVIAQTLQVTGFVVESFGSPRRALQRAVEERPDVVVMEPRSPGIDALATMRALRDLHGDSAPPVVWCTTVLPSATSVEAGAHLGLRGVVVKPFRLEALTALVLRVCRRAERERRLSLLGVPADQLAKLLLSADATQLWARAEIELVEAARRSPSLIAVGSDASEVAAAVRSAIRSVDVLGSACAHTLLVLLPDTDHAGAEAVARRVSAAVGGFQPRPPVLRLTRRVGEDDTDLLARAVVETILGRVG
jgi:PleD family two-component response regulator